MANTLEQLGVGYPAAKAERVEQPYSSINPFEIAIHEQGGAMLRVGAEVAWWDSLQNSTPSIFTRIPSTARASNGQMATSRNCSGR